jgi:signal peptidase I
MNINFPLILTSLMFLTGFIALLDVVYFAKIRKQKNIEKPNVIIEYARSFFPVFLIVLVIRSFIVQPFHVPTGSLEPTVLPGELLVVNQFTYGLRLPVLDTKVVKIGEPKTGDIVVFRSPTDEGMNLVKRVVGVPGDHLVYKDKVLYINGKEAKQTALGEGVDIEPTGNVDVQKYEEDLNGVKHAIFINPQRPSEDFEVTVPADAYFMMGDNRDNSNDSRYWGPAPEANLIGKAFLIWMSWDSQTTSIRWKRIGTVL